MFFNQCADKRNIVSCFKIQALKVANRAIKLKNIQLWGGLNLVRDEKEFGVARDGLNLNDTKLEKLDSDELDDLLTETSSRLVLNIYLF